MLDDKKIEEARNNAIKSIDNGDIVKTKDSLYVSFFLNNAKISLDSAKALFELSSNQKIASLLGFSNFNGYLWVINASYYSMFYIVRALLETISVKMMTDNAIHYNVFNALIYYFYSNGKLERRFIEDFKMAGEESSQLLGKEKARNVITDYSNEKEKRARFTYETSQNVMRSSAETSLNRARLFNEEIRKLIET